MPDWYFLLEGKNNSCRYSPEPSDRYDKVLVEFSSGKSTPAIFMDATEYGDVLVLSGAPYLQGIDERFDGDVSGIGKQHNSDYTYIQEMILVDKRLLWILYKSFMKNQLQSLQILTQYTTLPIILYVNTIYCIEK